MSLLHFTRPDGVAVLLRADHVVSVRAASQALGDAPSARAALGLANGSIQGVRETVAEVEEKLK